LGASAYWLAHNPPKNQGGDKNYDTNTNIKYFGCAKEKIKGQLIEVLQIGQKRTSGTHQCLPM